MNPVEADALDRLVRWAAGKAARRRRLDADDLAQDVRLRLIERPGSDVLKTADSIAVMAARKRNRRARLLSSMPAPDRTSCGADAKIDVVGAVLELPRKQAEAIVLVYWRRCTKPEVGAATGAILPTVSYRLKAAKRRLAEALASYAPDAT